MKIRTGYPIAALAASMLTAPVSSEAAGTTARARFSVDALTTCVQPAVQNFPVHAEGRGTLSSDRTATFEMDSNMGQERLAGTLGGKPTEAPGGSASLRVEGRHTLRAVREYPNNSIVIYMTVIGNSCTLKIENRLKPGKRQYTFYGNLGVALCSKPQITHAECSAY